MTDLAACDVASIVFVTTGLSTTDWAASVVASTVFVTTGLSTIALAVVVVKPFALVLAADVASAAVLALDVE